MDSTNVLPKGLEDFLVSIGMAKRLQEQPAKTQEAPKFEIPEGWVQEDRGEEAPSLVYSRAGTTGLSKDEEAAYKAGYYPPKVLPVTPQDQQPAQQAAADQSVAPVDIAAQEQDIIRAAQEARIANQPVQPVVSPSPVPTALPSQIAPQPQAAFQLPKEYEAFIGSLAKENQPLAKMMIGAQMQQQNALRQNAQANLQAINAQRVARINDIDRAAAQIPDEFKNYPAIQHEVQRTRNMANYEAGMRHAEIIAGTMDPHAAERYMKDARDTLEKQFDLKRFEDTDAYKKSLEVGTAMRKDYEKVIAFRNGINRMEELLKMGDRDQAGRFARSTLAQAANSLVSDNAIQTVEMMIRYPELINSIDLSQMQGKSAFNLTNLLKGALGKDEREKVIKEISGDTTFVKGIVEKAMDIAPEIFVQNAKNTANTQADALNQSMKLNIVDRTSPKVANVTYLPLYPVAKPIVIGGKVQGSYKVKSP